MISQLDACSLLLTLLLQDVVVPPSAVRDTDLVGAVWPPGSTLRRPQLGAAAQMAPAGAALDFRPAPGGAAQWCAISSAILTLILILTKP